MHFGSSRETKKIYNLQQRRNQPHISTCRYTVDYSVHTERVYTEVCSATLQNSWDPGFNSSQKTTKLQVFSEQRPRCATLKQHLIHITFYHHPRSHFIAWEILTGLKTHKVCGRQSFPWREGPGPSVWENSGSTNKPWFSNSHQPLGERRGWFFPNCVYHQSHRALYCQSNLLFERICRCVLVKIKATFKIMFIHRRMIFNVF